LTDEQKADSTAGDSADSRDNRWAERTADSVAALKDELTAADSADSRVD
jgi:hypothetical protein